MNGIKNWLEDRNAGMTGQIVRIFEVFEDFKLISQLREEMDKLTMRATNSY